MLRRGKITVSIGFLVPAATARCPFPQHAAPIPLTATTGEVTGNKEPYGDASAPYVLVEFGD